jgi:hypothetical protein
MGPGKDVIELSKTLVGLLPLAVGLIAYGIALSFFLGSDMALGRWLLGAFLVGHGLVHVMFAVPRPAVRPATANGIDYPFDMGQAWPVRAGLDAGLVRIVSVALVAAVVIGFVLAGLATVGVLVPAGWWRSLVVGSTVMSVLLLALAFSPGLLLGVAIDAVLLWLALAASWPPITAIAQRGGL